VTPTKEEKKQAIDPMAYFSAFGGPTKKKEKEDSAPKGGITP